VNGVKHDFPECFYPAAGGKYDIQKLPHVDSDLLDWNTTHGNYGECTFCTFMLNSLAQDPEFRENYCGMYRIQLMAIKLGTVKGKPKDIHHVEI
jgi:hypothetical protein